MGYEKKRKGHQEKRQKNHTEFSSSFGFDRLVLNLKTAEIDSRGPGGPDGLDLYGLDYHHDRDHDVPDADHDGYCWCNNRGLLHLQDYRGCSSPLTEAAD